MITNLSWNPNSQNFAQFVSDGAGHLDYEHPLSGFAPANHPHWPYGIEVI